MAILYVVLMALAATSRQWPYMFEYVAIDVPRLSLWTIPEIAAWYVMEAATSALVSITHIHFLTLLYPSRLEARLVFLLLGPLAILSSLMTLLPVITYSSYGSSGNSTVIANATDIIFNQTITSNATSPTAMLVSRQGLYDIFDSARNICSLTLSFLFTLSLLIWGFLVNRESAWRTDGGTAVFGAGAVLLALIGTGLNFLNVFTSSTFQWLRPLLWSVVLWQSFLGWWWWAGSASGIAAREFDMDRRGRKEQKRARRKKHRGGHSVEDEPSRSATSARLDRWRTSMTGTLSRRRQPPAPIITAIPPVGSNDLGDQCTISSNQSLSDSPSQDSTSSCRLDHTNTILAAVHRSWRSLRQAHVRAVRVQAIEQRQIQIQMQLENGHGLGRYPGTGDTNFIRQSRSDGEVSPPPFQPREFNSSRTLWINSFRKWRLKDSTRY
ncbi:hypothetical protein Clacol_002823 [Clathrus columnatus]|uniref:Uncharacterized protein n=1 Tax=Clathrus columnatus TaxID=1419009 RepID=A0AAV5A783_9AGAM|nr:hypothetical protein Clacol_002823 [Clathrus columnatus]